MEVINVQDKLERRQHSALWICGTSHHYITRDMLQVDKMWPSCKGISYPGDSGQVNPHPPQFLTQWC